MGWNATLGVWAASDRFADDGERLMMLALARFADDDGCCFPSVPTLAEMIGRTDRGARLILRRLEARGEIETEMSRGGKGRSSRYRLAKLNPENAETDLPG